MDPQLIWTEFIWPILRISLFVSLGLIVAQLIESLSWTQQITKLAKPITHLANLSENSAAGFSLAFVSGVTANSLLAEVYGDGKITKKELILANLLNSLPRFFLHLPTVFFLTLPFLHGAALSYVGITFAAALLQTAITILLGRLLLTPPQKRSDNTPTKEKRMDWRKFWKKMAKRLRRRVTRLLRFMVPIYILFFLLHHYGIFQWIEQGLAHLPFLSWLPAQSLGIILLHVTTEFSAGLAAASVVLANNSMPASDVVIALLIGNLLATPIRALRHQFPYYSGIYPLKLAVQLITISQILRASTIILATSLYALWAL